MQKEYQARDFCQPEIVTPEIVEIVEIVASESISFVFVCFIRKAHRHFNVTLLTDAVSEPSEAPEAR